MSLASLMTRSVTIHRRVPGSYDDPDGESETFVQGETLLAYVEQQTSLSRESVEYLSGRDTLVAHWLIVLPVGTEIEAYDRVETEYGMVEIMGRPAAPIAPRIGEHHVEVRGRTVEG